MDSVGATGISPVTADEVAANADAFGGLLHACVQAGASINFVLPFGAREATAFWTEQVLPPMRAGVRTVWAARDGGRIVGSVQLGYALQPNQPHRAEVTKLMVHPDHRRRGLAKALMTELEGHARRQGRSLITLDTRTGDAAERLYTALGYVSVGVIPGFCLDPYGSGRLDSTTVMYKAL